MWAGSRPCGRWRPWRRRRGSRLRHTAAKAIGLLASLHLDASIPNFLVQECCGNVVPQPRDKIWLEWFGFPAMRMVKGTYPFGGSRPMARVFLTDGSVAEW